jgi:hypothetical protein
MLAEGTVITSYSSAGKNMLGRASALALPAFSLSQWPEEILCTVPGQETVNILQRGVL